VTRLYLVRHGQAAARWDQDHDPGLDDVGRRQARALAEELEPRGPLPVVMSPLRRTRETASALEERWGLTAAVEPAVGEILSPSEDLALRTAWLRDVLHHRWGELDPDLRQWRDAVVAALLAQPGDTVVVTHFVAINAAVGAATGDDRVVCFKPDNCSCTVMEADGGRLGLVELGRQRQTLVR
jgi:broad specificity phosphatase PhoE